MEGKYSDVLGAGAIIEMMKSGRPIEITVNPGEDPLVALGRKGPDFIALAKEQGMDKVLFKAGDMLISVSLGE